MIIAILPFILLFIIFRLTYPLYCRIFNLIKKILFDSEDNNLL